MRNDNRFIGLPICICGSEHINEVKAGSVYELECAGCGKVFTQTPSGYIVTKQSRHMDTDRQQFNNIAEAQYAKLKKWLHDYDKAEPISTGTNSTAIGYSALADRSKQMHPEFFYGALDHILAMELELNQLKKDSQDTQRFFEHLGNRLGLRYNNPTTGSEQNGPGVGSKTMVMTVSTPDGTMAFTDDGKIRFDRAKPESKVYAREECNFRYCPYPEHCKPDDACIIHNCDPTKL